MIKTKGKLIAAVIVIFMLITSFWTYTSYAAEISEIYVNREFGVPADGVISYDMLALWWDILCAEHGIHIPSMRNTGQVYIGAIGTNPSKSTVASVSEFEEYEEKLSPGESSKYADKEWIDDCKTNKLAKYESKGLVTATAKQAYILCEAPLYTGYEYAGPEQKAWWQEENMLYNTAKAYEEFVKKIAYNVDNASTYKPYSHQYPDGTLKTIKLPQINEEKMKNMVSFNTVTTVNGGYEVDKTGERWASNVTVNYDEHRQKYLVGPFSINYIEASFNNVDFGMISNFEVYTDASSSPLPKDKWQFVWLNGQRSAGDIRKYPASNEVFYIEMDYIEDATMITGMDIDYKYLLVGGEYELFDGKFKVSDWSLESEVTDTKSIYAKDDEGNYIYDENGDLIHIGEEASEITWYFERTDLDGEFESQKLDIVQQVARWYETQVISMRANYGNLEIAKKAVDEAGNELSAAQIKEKFGEDQYFDFKVTLTHSSGKVETDIVTVRAGDSEKRNYSWTGESSAPTYKIEEISATNEAWQAVSISQKTGTLKDSDTVTVTAVNKTINQKSNTIRIQKTLSSPAIEDELFRFKVTVRYHDGRTDQQIASIIVPQGHVTGNIWESSKYTWYGENAPTYTVEEIEIPTGYTATITPNAGVLDGTGVAVDVKAYNSTEPGVNSNKIKINKTIAGGLAERTENFTFELVVTYADGTAHTETGTVTVPQGQSSSEIDWVSKEYTWQNGENAPTYTVKETGNSEGYNAVITPASGALDDSKSTICVEAINYRDLEPEWLENRIEINKTIDGGVAKEDEVFKFRVTVTFADGSTDVMEPTITVPAGQITGEAWVSDIFRWAKGAQTPTYKVEEIEHPSEYTPEIINGEGELNGEAAKVIVNAINHKEGDKKGSLTIEKALVNGQTTAETFDFKVTVDGVKNATNLGAECNISNGKVEFTVNDVKPGEKRGPFEFVWEGEAPTYTVEEINLNENGNATVSSIEVTENAQDISKPNSNTVKGTLVGDGTANVNVKFTNKFPDGPDNPDNPDEPDHPNSYSGNIKVVKDIYTTEKITKETLKAEGAKFEIEVVIEGTFEYGGQKYDNTTKVITKTLPDDNWDFVIEGIKWSGSKAPTYTVREKNLPNGWKTRTIKYSSLENSSTNSEGHNLVAGQTVSATIVNELPSTTVIDLMFSMGGIVWVDDTVDEKNQDSYYNKPNGVYDKNEKLKENAEVTVYRVVYNESGKEVERTVAKAYKDKDNNELTFPIITKTDGKWDVPRISVPGLSDSEKAAGYTASYDVQFAYDGENYEPTEFLAYKIKSDGGKEKIQGDNFSRANGYKNETTSGKDQYAKDSMAIEVSNGAKRIAEVSGKTAIDANGNTIGIVTLDNGETREITYSSGNAGSAYPTISRVNTTGKDGLVLDAFKATARTSAGNLTFPFDKSGYDGVTLQEVNKTIDALGVHHTYKYMAVYNYCLNINLGLKERATVDIGLSKNLSEAKVVVNEKLYQYEYSGKFDLEEEKVETLDKNIKVTGETQDITYDLDLYKSDYYYRADMYRNGEIYGALEKFYKTINKTPEDTEMDIYLTYKIKVKNTSSSYDVVVNRIDDYYSSTLTLVRVDEYKYLKTKTLGGNQSDVNAEEKVAIASDYANSWEDVELGIVGSDKDAKGENIIYNKMTANNLEIKLAAGSEQTLTLTFKVNKGKDMENAVANSIKLGQKANLAEIASYTTFVKDTNFGVKAGKVDRDSAPGNVNISAHNEKVWYEDDTFSAPRLNVNIEQEGTRTIDGIVWEDNSRDTHTENPGYNQQVGNGIKEDDEEIIKNLTTELVEKVAVKNVEGPHNGKYTEYDYIWPTDERLDIFNGLTIEQVAGFDSRIVTEVDGIYRFNNVVAGDYVVRFTYGDKGDKEDEIKMIKSADYSEAEYYNGQDYKSSKFMSKLKGENSLRADSYLDIGNLEAGRNAAVDSEVRRLEVVQKSREITYDNAIIMKEYQEPLFTDYYMFADTPKLDINIEYYGFGNSEYKYEVKNVDFALEERPITKLTLDKQIEEITLTTSDGTVIMDAKYNIDYEVNADNGEIKAKVTLDRDNSHGTDKLQALNRDLGSGQGFRYINVDWEILEATTITVKYRFTVLDTGEVDRTGELANMVYKEDSITFDAARNDLSTKLAIYTKVGNKLENTEAQGFYVGNIYYHAVDGSEPDDVVKTTVRQLVDYIDVDVLFSSELNSTANTSWRNVTASELKELIKDDIISVVNDKENVLDVDGIQYETENRNNLVVSVDSTESDLNNAGFIVELLPNEATKEKEEDAGKDRAYMNLTVTRYVGSDSGDLQIDNIVEIIKYNNEVGRRNGLTVPGNQVPAEALLQAAPEERIRDNGALSYTFKYERDTSATEVITLSPPTGSGLMTWKLQVIGSVTLGLVIIAGGIILIKKKVLK